MRNASGLAGLAGSAIGGYNALSGISSYAIAETEEQKMAAIGKTMGGVGTTAGTLIGTMIAGPVGAAIGGVLGDTVGNFIGTTFGQDLMPIFEELKPLGEDLKEIFIGEDGKTGLLGEIKDWWKENKDPITEGLYWFTSQLALLPNTFKMVAAGVKMMFYKIKASIPLLGSDEDLEKAREAAQEVLALKAQADEREAAAAKRAEEREAKRKRKAEEEAKISADGSHKNGLDYVPKDDYLARLHKGELVLTSAMADVFRHGFYRDVFDAAKDESKGINSNIGNFIVKWANGIDQSKVDANLLEYFNKTVESDRARRFFNRNNINEILIFSGLRSPDKQKLLSEQGIGSQRSAHLVGRALDFNFMSNGDVVEAFYYPREDNNVNKENEPIYREFGNLLQKYSNGNLRSGAFFSTKDPNHVEMSHSRKIVENFLENTKRDLERQEEQAAIYRQNMEGEALLNELENNYDETHLTQTIAWGVLEAEKKKRELEREDASKKAFIEAKKRGKKVSLREYGQPFAYSR